MLERNILFKIFIDIIHIQFMTNHEFFETFVILNQILLSRDRLNFK